MTKERAARYRDWGLEIEPAHTETDRYRLVDELKLNDPGVPAGLDVFDRNLLGRERVRMVKSPRVTSERYLSTWKDVSTWPAHPKEGEHAAIWESAPTL